VLTLAPGCISSGLNLTAVFFRKNLIQSSETFSFSGYLYGMKTTTSLCLIAISMYFFLALASDGYSQNSSRMAVIAAFSMPDTACMNNPIPIENLSQGATTYLWQFCTGDPLTDIHGIDLGNPSNTLDEPLGIVLVYDGVYFYAFNTNSISGTITRTTWMNGLTKPPVSVNLGNFGILSPGIYGIQVENDNGKWYAFVTDGSSLVRISLGTSLSADVQMAKKVVTSPFMNKARGLVIEKDGNKWVGFCTNFPASTITRFIWSDSLTSTPEVADLGNIGGLTEPMQPALLRDNSGWYMFVANTTSLTQLSFGYSLLNTPTGINLGNLGWMTDDRGMSLFIECNNAYGLITNHNLVPNLLLQLHFTGGISGTKSITPLGSVANLYEPLALSETVNLGDTIFTIALNATPSMTTLFFPPCTSSPLPPSTAFEPPPVVMSAPGTYTVKLIVDQGLPTEQTVCKEVFVDAPLNLNLGNDTTICDGSVLTLDPGNVFNHYLWNTGDTSRTIAVSQPGTYSLQVTNDQGCQTADTLRVEVVEQINITVDTSICHGEKYLAGGAVQTTSGTYVDSLVIQGGCYKVITTNLEVKPEIVLNIGADTCLSQGDTIGLTAQVPGASSITWPDGSHNPAFTVTGPGNYWVSVVVNDCPGSDTIVVTKCKGTIRFFFPTAFSPNGDGLNDLFMPKGSEVVEYNIIIYDRWGQMVFESHEPATGWDGRAKGEYCQPGVYSYIATFADPFSPTEVTKITGTFTLVR